MKRLLLLLPAALLAFSAEAQQTGSGERDLILAVRNYGGNVMHNPGIRAMIKGRNEPPRSLDRWGEAEFRVSPGDTIVLITKKGKRYGFLADEYDGVLEARFKSRNKLAIPRRNDYSDKLVVGFGVNPAVDNPIVPAHVKDAKSENYETLKEFMQDNVADVRFRGDRLTVVGANSASNDYFEALVVVDGELMPSFDMANKNIHPYNVVSIDVMKNGGEATYGNRAMSGVVVITTVKSLIEQQNEPPRTNTAMKR